MKTGIVIVPFVDGKTGNLLDNEEPEKWSIKIKEMFDNKNNFNPTNNMNSDELKNILKTHVEDNFSLKRMYSDLYSQVQKLFKNKKLKGD